MTLWAREGDILDVVVVAFEPIANVRVAFSGRCFLLGVQVTESTGTATALMKLLDGLDNLGKPIGRYSLAISETQTGNPGMPGIPCNHGLTVNMISGSVDLYLTIGRWVKAP